MLTINNKLHHAIGILAVLVISCGSLKAEDLRKVISLNGDWNFSVGDDMEWASPAYDDTNWDRLRVPRSWEAQGYSEYNGYAWYRREFTMYDLSAKSPIYLFLGYIDDADEVYLNGKLIAKSGQMPPSFKTAFGQERRYLIPREYLKINERNHLAIRVFDTFGNGGMVHGRIGIYVDEDYELLDFNLAGTWKFHLGDNKQWKEKNFSDDMWTQIPAPALWEKQGYENYDGYAWYRKDFTLPANLRNEDLYLILGKIDDYDYVYLNGELIGNVFDLEKDGDYRRRGYEYNARRIYKIPKHALSSSGKNTLAIRVFDSGGGGGIYQGPLGFMTRENHKVYYRNHYQSQGFWDFILDEFFID